MDTHIPEINKRIKELINHYTGGRVAPFSELLNGVSQQKLNRLFNIDTRTGKYPLVTTDILVAITEKFVDINSEWLLKGVPPMIIDSKNAYSPNDTNNKHAFISSKYDSNVSPTNAKNVSPTVSPTRNLGVPKVVTVSENDKELIPLVPVKAAAGYLNGYGDPVFVESLPTIQFPNFGAGSHRAFEIKGSSMNPTLHNKSIVIARWVESFDDIEEDARKIYIVVTKEYGIVAKRVLNRINDRGVLVMVSDNNNKKDYGNYDVYPEDVKELWYVRGQLSFEFPEPDHSLVNRIDDLESRFNKLYEQQLKIT